MTNEKLYEAIGDVNDNYIEEAKQIRKQIRKQPIWFKWAVCAACLCLVAGITIRIGFVPAQMTDVFREGTLIEITNESELPAVYDGELLAFHMDFEEYEFYYKLDGAAENTDDWYSLLASKYNANGDIVLHCMFGETTVEDWKVSRVFTKKATQTTTINGVEVQIAKMENSLKYKYWHYAIFEYDDVVYDLRVQSDNAEYVYEVLNQLLSEEVYEKN